MTSSDGQRRVLVVEDEWMVAAPNSRQLYRRPDLMLSGHWRTRGRLLRLPREDLNAALLDVELGRGLKSIRCRCSSGSADPFAFVTSKPRSHIAPSTPNGHRLQAISTQRD